jgi:A/G-specific adenine glycosylase
VVPVVDGNVFRYYLVILMLKLILLWLQPKKLQHWLSIDAKDDPAIFNQAIMEFGALQCVPKVQLHGMRF